MNIKPRPDSEISLEIECYSWKMNADVLWSELVLHSQVYARTNGPWQVEVHRYTQGGAHLTLNYRTSDEQAPPNIGPGTYREALETRTKADFTDPVWTGTTGDHFTFKCWRE